MLTQRASPSGWVSMTVPTPSTWPLTRWPPPRSPNASDASRLTASPRRSVPRVVRRAVSGITSALKPPAAISTTVRQVPLTATLSPIRRSAGSPCAATRRRPPCGPTSASTSPNSVTIPENTSSHSTLNRRRAALTAHTVPAHHDVVASTLHGDPGERRGRGQRGHAPACHGGRCPLAPHDAGSDEGDHPVGELLVEEGTVDLGAALHQDADALLLSQELQHLAERHPSVRARCEGDHPGPGCLEDPAGGGRGLRGGGDHAPAVVPDHARGRREREPAVDHHPERLAGHGPLEAGRQLRVVRQHGPHPDPDRVVAMAEQMAEMACRVTGDPAGLAGSGGDAAVQGGGELGGDEGQPCRHPA